MDQSATPSLNASIWGGLSELYAHVSPARRRELLALVALMLMGAFAELATIGSVIPFLAILTAQPGNVQLPTTLATLVSLAAKGGIFTAGLLFGGFALFAALIRLQLAWMTQDFFYRLGSELALQTQQRILSQPYIFHVLKHSSTLISSTDKVEIVVFDVLLPLTQAVIAAFIGLFLIAGLLYVEPLATIIAAGAFAAIYWVVSAVTKNRRGVNSAIVGTAYHERLKIEQESLGGIRDVIIDGSQSMHLRLFEQVNNRLARARATTNFTAQAPRFIVEGTGIAVLAGIAVLLSKREGGIALTLPFLGALALGAQRLLPLIQTLYSGWSVATARRSIIGQVADFLRLPLPSAMEVPPPMPLRRSIALEEVGYCYPGRADSPAIENVSLDIPKGSTLALIGKTGSGKTTFADLLMGLIEPSAGRICIDGEPLTSDNVSSWHRNIAHVPQSIFLPDITIAQNIALSLPDAPPDQQRIVMAAKKAELHDFVLSLPAGYETLIGEHGIRLSGGQRQRLGIARAIYKGASVLVFDEATNALDEKTEAAVIGALDELRSDGSTIIIVAHRLSTVRRCNLIARLDAGRLVKFGPASEVLRDQQSLS
jgi:ABC-type multidrug transport system fused ATPase/permease subunit